MSGSLIHLSYNPAILLLSTEKDNTWFTADGDCNCEIKRCLLLGRKTMTNIDSILKSRDISLPTKVRLLKFMVFQKSCTDVRGGPQRRLTTKELMLLNCWCWRRLLRVHWTARSNQSILKEINTEYSLEGLMLKLKFQYFGFGYW